MQGDNGGNFALQARRNAEISVSALIGLNLIADVEAAIQTFNLGFLVDLEVQRNFGWFVLVTDEIKIALLEHGAVFGPVFRRLHAGQQVIPGGGDDRGAERRRGAGS
jgi:hypothetical protein